MDMLKGYSAACQPTFLVSTFNTVMKNLPAWKKKRSIFCNTDELVLCYNGRIWSRKVMNEWVLESNRRELLKTLCHAETFFLVLDSRFSWVGYFCRMMVWPTRRCISTIQRDCRILSNKGILLLFRERWLHFWNLLFRLNILRWSSIFEILLGLTTGETKV